MRKLAIALLCLGALAQGCKQDGPKQDADGSEIQAGDTTDGSRSSRQSWGDKTEGSQGTAEKPAPVQDAYLVKPGISVGPITSSASRQTLDSLFGPTNVKDTKLDQGEGMFIPGTVVYPGTEKEMEIIWGDMQAQKYPASIVVKQPNSPWHTSAGIKIGTTLNDLRLKNAGEFVIFGFGWAAGGQLVRWNGGQLDETHRARERFSLYLSGNPKAVSMQELKSVTNKNHIPTSNPVLDKMELKVSRMEFYFPGNSF